jgi:radical SAM protein with 4Fe4S-binding SPASM domain
MCSINIKHLLKKIQKKVEFETEYLKNYESANDGTSLRVDTNGIICDDKELELLEIKNITDEKPLKNTKRISIELSNLCNYAFIHKKCPVNLENEKKILPSKIVLHVIDTLEKLNFAGIIAFHTYNEQMIDPRLFKFIEYTRNKCKQCDIFISTNGYYLNQTIANELIEIGVTSIHVSAYTPNEYKRLSSIKVNIPYNVEKMILMDEVLSLYQAPFINLSLSCNAPLEEIIITREGFISLCCRDWQRRYNFGNLNDHNFEEIIRNGILQAVYKKLNSGNRFLDICKRCNWQR